MTEQQKADIALIGVSILWGASYMLSKSVLYYLPTYTFLASRFLTAGVLSAALFYRRMLRTDTRTIKLSICSGLLLFATYALQTTGLHYTTVSKSAFITGISVILVPLFATLLLKNKPERSAIWGVVLAIIGLALMTITEAIGLNVGDLYTFICAVCYAFYLISVSKFTRRVDSVAFATWQLILVGSLSLIAALLWEDPTLPTSSVAWINLAILTLGCTLGAYVVQNVAQKYTTSTHTALIFTVEPVYAAIFGYLIFGEVLGAQGTVGAGLIILGMLVAELDLFAVSSRKKAVDGSVS